MSFVERLRERLCLMYWSWKHPKTVRSFSISTSDIHSRNVLVVLPANFEDFDTARHVLEPLLQRMTPRFATMLVRDNFRSWLPSDLRARLLTYDVNQHNWLGLPPDRLQRAIRELDADVVVNLTPGFCIFTAGLVAASDAPLRISLDYEHAAKFYNVLIAPEEGKTLAERYEVLLGYV